MKYIIFIMLLYFAVSSYGQDNLKAFNDLLGKEQSKAFDKAVESFEKFLATNYPDEPSIAEKNAKFLEDIRDFYTKGRPDWTFPKETAVLFELWEKTGLRSEIRLWPNENYYPYHLKDEQGDSKESNNDSLSVFIDDEIIPITQKDKDGNPVPETAPRDSFLLPNNFGKYLFALEECCWSDTIIQDYLNTKRTAGDISPTLMAGGYLFYKVQLDDPMVLRIVVAEIYFFLVKFEQEAN